MMKFLFLGLMRDRSRSLFPLLVTAAGVALTVLTFCWIGGVEDNFIGTNAKFITGHCKVVTRAAGIKANGASNDLALLEAAKINQYLHTEFPDYDWLERIDFGGLIDIPDENGETKSQGPCSGMAFDLLNEHSSEHQILKLKNALRSGRLIEKNGEILLSDQFAEKLGVKLGERVTLLSSTMHGSMSTYNFTLVGTIQFGIMVFDRGAAIIDLGDARLAFDMQDAASKIIGFSKDELYHESECLQFSQKFNLKFSDPEDEFSPQMFALREQASMADLLDMVRTAGKTMLIIFLFVMSLILWNTGLMGSLRRYGEIGIRLAIGEEKGHLYRSMLTESFVMGVIGSCLGTVVGLIIAGYLQTHGIDISGSMKNSSLFVSNVWRAKITTLSVFIGFLPGVFASFIGAAISGIGIYRRQTAQLFKELEV